MFEIDFDFSDMDCWWRIDSGADDLRLLLFLTFDTACPGDQIDIYDGKELKNYLTDIVARLTG